MADSSAPAILLEAYIGRLRRHEAKRERESGGLARQLWSGVAPYTGFERAHLQADIVPTSSEPHEQRPPVIVRVVVEAEEETGLQTGEAEKFQPDRRTEPLGSAPSAPNRTVNIRAIRTTRTAEVRSI